MQKEELSLSWLERAIEGIKADSKNGIIESSETKKYRHFIDEALRKHLKYPKWTLTEFLVLTIGFCVGIEVYRAYEKQTAECIDKIKRYAIKCLKKNLVRCKKIADKTGLGQEVAPDEWLAMFFEEVIYEMQDHRGRCSLIGMAELIIYEKYDLDEQACIKGIMPDGIYSLEEVAKLLNTNADTVLIKCTPQADAIDGEINAYVRDGDVEIKKFSHGLPKLRKQNKEDTTSYKYPYNGYERIAPEAIDQLRRNAPVKGRVRIVVPFSLEIMDRSRFIDLHPWQELTREHLVFIKSEIHLYLNSQESTTSHFKRDRKNSSQKNKAKDAMEKILNAAEEEGIAIDKRQLPGIAKEWRDLIEKVLKQDSIKFGVAPDTLKGYFKELGYSLKPGAKKGGEEFQEIANLF